VIKKNGTHNKQLISNSCFSFKIKMSIDWIMFLNKKFKSFENVVAIALQSIFHLEIYQNYVFFFIFV
jgi:hypothetical protein